MTCAAAPKVPATSIHVASPIELDTAARSLDMLCIACRVKPRGAGGRLTRCLECLKADVDRERQQREAKVREKAKAPVSAKKQARKRR